MIIIATRHAAPRVLIHSSRSSAHSRQHRNNICVSSQYLGRPSAATHSKPAEGNHCSVHKFKRSPVSLRATEESHGQLSNDLKIRESMTALLQFGNSLLRSLEQNKISAQGFLDALELRAGMPESLNTVSPTTTIKEISLSIMPEIQSGVLRFRSINPEPCYDWFFETEKDHAKLRRLALHAVDLDQVVELAKETLLEVMDLHLRVHDSIDLAKRLKSAQSRFLGPLARDIECLKNQTEVYEFIRESQSLMKLVKEAEDKIVAEVEVLSSMLVAGTMSRVDAVLHVAVEKILNANEDESPWALDCMRLPSLLIEWADRYAYEPSPALCKRILQSYPLTDLLNPCFLPLPPHISEEEPQNEFPFLDANNISRLPPPRSHYLRAMAKVLLEEKSEEAIPWLLNLHHLSPVTAFIAVLPGKDELWAYQVVMSMNTMADSRLWHLLGLLSWREKSTPLVSDIQPNDASLMQLMMDHSSTAPREETSFLVGLVQYRCVASGCRPLVESLLRYCSDKQAVLDEVMKTGAAWYLVNRSLLSSDHPCPSSLLQQLLVMHFSTYKFKEETWKENYGPSEPLNEILDTAIDLELHLPQPAVNEAVKLVRLAESFNQELPMKTLKRVAIMCLKSRREDICLVPFQQLLVSCKPRSPQLGDEDADTLIAMMGNETFSSLLQAIPPLLRPQWLSVLLSESARSKSGSKALLLIEAIGATPVSIDLCSQLAGAFLTSPQDVDGASAAIKALVLAEKKSLVHLCQDAKAAYTSSLLNAPPGSSVAEIRNLAFDISPSVETAVDLLSPSEHPTLPSTVFYKIIRTAKDGGWKGIGSLALSCINSLGPDDRVASLSEGSFTLAGLLLNDVIMAAGDSEALLSFVKFEGRGWRRDQWRGFIAEAIEGSNLSPSHSQLAFSLASLSISALGQEWTWVETLIRIALFQSGNIRLQKPQTIEVAARPLFMTLQDSKWLLDWGEDHSRQIEFIAWLGSSKSLTSPSAAHNKWLMPSLADLCESLTSDGPAWAKTLIKTTNGKEAASYLAKACEKEEMQVPLLDILQAFQTLRLPLPKDVALAAAEAVVSLEAWNVADPILQSLDLDLDSWSSDSRVASCVKTLTKLPPQSAVALITLLPYGSQPSEKAAMTRSRALSAAADLLPRFIASYDNAFTPIDSLILQLKAREDAASAAADLDAFWGLTVLQQQINGSKMALAEALKADLSIEDIFEGYESLFDVIDAARRPSEAVEVVLELMESEETKLEHRYQQSLAGRAIAMCHEFDFHPAPCLLILRELLYWHGKLLGKDLIKQLLKVSESSDVLATEVEKAVGEEGYYAMQEIAAHPEINDEEVEARPNWIKAATTARTTSSWRSVLEIETRKFDLTPIRRPTAVEAKEVEPMWEPDEAQDDFEEIAEGGERKKDRPVVVLFGGREFKDSDRKMLEGMFPHAELRWCGSARDAGQGGERNLEQSITKGRVELVYIQTRHNGHNLSYRIINRCKSAGVEYRIIGKCGNKAIMKSESMRNRYRDV